MVFRPLSEYLQVANFAANQLKGRSTTHGLHALDSSPRTYESQCSLACNATMKRRRARLEDFTVGWICALHIELTAAREALDEEYERLDDVAHCTLGRIGQHNVAVACLPEGHLGTSSAAAVADHMQNVFPALRYGLMVGIAGGVPSKSVDIRLGDVVISCPQGRYGGVVQYDFGKTGPGGQHFPNGSLNSPNRVLLQAVANMRSYINAGRTNVESYLSTLDHRGLFPRPGPETEKLFDPSYDHVLGDTCDSCLEDRVVDRSPRPSQEIVIHYGTIASGNQVVKDALTRDRLSAQHGGVLCFEMEAAGLMNIFPCLVIRGICDYSDSHKNKNWQPFAAAAAAACAKAVLSYVPTVPRNLDDDPDARGPFPTYPAPRDEPVTFEANEFTHSTTHRQSIAENGLGSLSLYTKSSLTEAKRRDYHDSLRFGQIDARHATIQDAQAETCLWLLGQPEYQDWLDLSKLTEHHGFFWIKGNPGTGKSTIMKFALAHMKSKMAGQNAMERTGNNETIVIKFFFNARGEELEKSVLGMYRSLLFQLLERAPDLQHVFSLLPPEHSNGQTTYQSDVEPLQSLYGDQTTYQSDVETLQSLFGHAVQRLGQRSLICFIDALDECHEDGMREMIEFFEHLGDLAASSTLNLRTCLSSRHYPHVTIQHGLCLVLEDQTGHNDDISKYVDSKMNKLRSKKLDGVKREICERSSGIFLWVVLVVRILKKDYDAGQIQALKKRLKEIPDGLDRLFDDVLTRDTQNIKRLILCLQWVLFTARPLKPIELFYAVMAGTEEPESIAQLGVDDTEDEILENFVLDSSKGLAALTKGEAKTVQFIHESVRDYLLKTRLQRHRVDLSSNFPGISHETLKTCCHTYIAIVRPEDPGSRIPPGFPDSATWREKNAAPFLQCAVRNILFHADAAAEHGVNQERFLDAFPYKWWVKVRDSLEKRYSSERYRSGVSPLYIFANESLPSLISSEVRKVSFIDIKGGYYDYPLNAAIANRSRKTLEALLVAGDNSLPSGDSATENALYVTPQGREAAISGVLKAMVPSGETLLLFAVHCYQIDLLKILLQTHKVDVEPRDAQGRTALSVAATLGWAEVVKLLLWTGKVDINSVDVFGHTPLAWAARNGHAAVVSLLLDTDKVSIEFLALRGQTPLSLAAERGHAAVVSLLLDTGKVDIESPDLFGRTTLSLAAQYGYAAVVSLLLDTGKVDIESPNLSGQTPLSLAAEKGYAAVVSLLLDTDKVNIESRCQLGQTPLSLAAENGHATVVSLLLDTGKVDVESPSLSGQTPLLLAVEKGHTTVVSLLLDTDKVDVESPNLSGQTPLSLAAEKGYLAVVSLLLDTGKVDIESPTPWGQTPLSLAIGGRHQAVVKLLIQTKKLDIESSDWRGLTPICWALFSHLGAVVELLFSAWMVCAMSKGRTLNVKRLGLHNEDDYGRTPLQFTLDYDDAVKVAKFLESRDEVCLQVTTHSHAIAENETPTPWNFEELMESLVAASECNLNTENEESSCVLRKASDVMPMAM
ncbi:hypothetical protein LTR47_000994 [Exophiala xenobiotica]|nr:hypothetical protein LTR47_000994 [Exophiala xenobiotica]KAK5255063.1 hypothetical protein LTS06_000847 [Exophiala xenobiotica]KAK5355653.1 hypothetical protein LTR61_001326 [Exophiala xenobiotica]KAK5385450.1 hypothetical protein LTR11_001823 [Exophiala xenobiotica]KAK5386618.1 hypothetical protein LTS03_001892 [Exophiala xenobiotica]